MNRNRNVCGGESQTWLTTPEAAASFFTASFRTHTLPALTCCIPSRPGAPPCPFPGEKTKEKLHIPTYIRYSCSVGPESTTSPVSSTMAKATNCCEKAKTNRKTYSINIKWINRSVILLNTAIHKHTHTQNENLVMQHGPCSGLTSSVGSSSTMESFTMYGFTDWQKKTTNRIFFYYLTRRQKPKVQPISTKTISMHSSNILVMLVDRTLSSQWDFFIFFSKLYFRPRYGSSCFGFTRNRLYTICLRKLVFLSYEAASKL